jgi:chemotaxis protein MotB
MRKKRQMEEGGGDSWMNTYADMVTLLLCFFVLLFAMSTIDSEKYHALANAFSDKDLTDDMIESLVGNNEQIDPSFSYPGPGGVEGGIDSAMDSLEEYIQEQGLNDYIEVYHGDGYEFVRFKDNLMFSGNSYQLLDQSKVLLDAFCTAIAPYTDEIQELRIMGHTTQANAFENKDVDGDRYLSSNRATAVLNYIHSKNLISPERLVAIGYGQHHPIAPFDTAENRAKNRRVEIVIFTDMQGNVTIDNLYKEIGGGGKSTEEQAAMTVPAE